MILAIESSCDESALALFDPARGLVRELISSQAAEHEKYGGVVPELASRMHLSALPLLLADFHAELAQAKTIAVTRGPGLLPCLSMGVTLARSLALARGLPIVGVNHLRAHVHSPFIAVHAADPAGFAAARAALPDLCAGYQHAIIEQLVSKTGAVLDLGGYKSVGLSGGVANNRTLRARLTNAAQQRGLPMLVAEPKHCGDNAGMIAFAAWADVGLPVGAAAVPAASLTVDQV